METKTIVIIVGAIGGVLLLGCACAGVGVFFMIQKVRDAAEREQRANDLKQVALAMHSHYDITKRMPATVEDFQTQLQVSPQVMNRLRQGEIVVVLDALPPTQQTAGTSNVLYAWDTKPAPGGVRLVAYMDGSTRILTESEFQNAPKAATSKAK
jgi:hypothetical protein